MRGTLSSGAEKRCLSESQGREKPMIVSRSIFYAKWGKVDALKAMMKGMFEGELPEGVKHGRLLTDLDGRYFRLIAELEFENLAAWESWRNREFASGSGGGDQTDPMTELAEWGEQEFYTVEVSV